MDDLQSQPAVGIEGGGALYNMAPTEAVQKQIKDTDQPPVGFIPPDLVAKLSCDKLRLGCYVRGHPDVETLFPDPKKVMGGGVGFGWRAARNFGVQRIRKRSMLLFGERGDHGVCYLEVQEVQDSSLPLKIILEFNPNKLFEWNFGYLSAWFLPRVGRPWAEWWVERHDIAFDYFGADRARFVLDDPARKLDMFGVGRCGPETERSGYRKGSHLRAQVYDKREEQGGEGDAQVRFEVSVNALVSRRFGKGRIQPEPPTIAELGSLPWPADGVGLRFLPHGGVPSAPTHEWGLTLLARAYGMKLAKFFAMHWLGKRRLEAWSDCMVPEVRPVPADLYRASWANVVRDLMARFTTTMTN